VGVPLALVNDSSPLALSWGFMARPDDSVSKFMDQITAIWSAPRPFILALVSLAALIVGGSYWLFDWRYSGIIGHLESRIKLTEAQRDDYKTKLGGATPDEAKAKLEALQRIVYTAIGSKWEPLTKDEIERLGSTLETIPAKFLNILYENQLGKDFAQTLLEAFKKAKWREVYLSQTGGLGVGLAVSRGTGTALKIKEALEASTKLHPALQYPEEDESGGLFVIVGINPAAQ